MSKYNEYLPRKMIKVLTTAAICSAILLAGLPSVVTAKDCSNESTREKEKCEASDESSAKTTTDTTSGLEVVEIKTDLDWKRADKASVPWSKIVKIKSDLDGSYELNDLPSMCDPTYPEQRGRICGRISL